MKNMVKMMAQTDVNGTNVDQIDPDVMSLSLIKRF